MNNTKIKYLNVEGKIYQVTNISFFHMSIEAVETDLSMEGIAEDELWDIKEFHKYKVRLVNNGGLAEIVDFEEWKDKQDSQK